MPVTKPVIHQDSMHASRREGGRCPRTRSSKRRRCSSPRDKADGASSERTKWKDEGAR